MNEYVEKALLHLTGKSNIETVTTEELADLANAHPYFPVAQVLLAKKLKNNNSDSFLLQVQKTALYFSNPYWLHYQLMSAAPTLSIDQKDEREEDKQLLLEEPNALPEDERTLEVTENGSIQLAAPASPAALLETSTSIENTEAAPPILLENEAKNKVDEQIDVYATVATDDEDAIAKNKEDVGTNEPAESNDIISDEHAPFVPPVASASTGIVTIDENTNTGTTETSNRQEETGIQEVVHHEPQWQAGETQEVLTKPDFIFSDEADTSVKETISAIEDAESGQPSINTEHISSIQSGAPEDIAGTSDDAEGTTQLQDLEEPAAAFENVEERQELAESEDQQIVPAEYEQQPPHIPDNFIQLDHPEFAGDSHNSLQTQGFLVEDPGENDYPEYVPHHQYHDDPDQDYNTQYNYEGSNGNETSLIEFSQRPPLPTDILQLDNPLFAAGDESQDVAATVAASEKNEDEIFPDELHPEKEEVLEELMQEKADEEEEMKESSPATVEQLSEQTEITLPVHEEDSQIIDEFVESQHEQKNAETTTETQRVPSTDEKEAPTASTPSPAVDEPLIPIEPYHTIDYFASQGIKLSLEKNPQDKLGKQLRTFTQWLRHMKKLGPEDAIKSSENEQMESNILGIANASNEQQEIVTEAMAEVLIKQGKNQQAIEVYNKLSFLNPDKSTYFADQIQKIKR